MRRGLAGIGLVVLGCADPTNREACRDYYQALLDLDCVGPGAYDPEERCPAELDDDPCELHPFYSCRTDQASCVDGHLDLGDPDSCVLSCPSS